jgi:hypothetical protein
MSTAVRPPQPPAPPPPPHPHASPALVDSEGFIDDHIRRTRRSLKVVDLAATVLTLVIGLLAFLFVAGLVDHWLIPGGLGPGGRIAMFCLLVAGMAWYAVRQFGPLVRSISPVYAAHTIEQSAPTLKNSLLNVLLFRTQRQGMSAKVYHALEQQAAQRLSASAADAAIDHSGLLRLGYVLLAVIAACAIYAVASPKNLAVSAARVIAPWSDLAAPSRVQILDVQPGDSMVAIGERVHVSAEMLALHTDEPVRVHYTTADESQVDESILMTRPTSAGRHSADLPRTADVSRGTGAPGGDVGVQQDLEYWIEAGDAVSRRYKLTVFERPTIVVQRVRYAFPTYTGEPTQTVEGVGDVRGLEGTDVTITALASQDIKSAYVDFDSDGTSDARMTVDGRRASASFKLQLRDDRRTPWHKNYTLRFTSTAGRSNEDPAQYNIEVLPDYAPEVQITKPDEPQVTVRVDDTVSIAVEARDPDFAVADVRLVGRVGDREIVLGQLLNGRTHAGLFKHEHRFTPADAKLKAGDVVEYWAEARDNRAPEPNLGFSEHRTLRIAGDEQPGGENQQPGDGGGAQGDNGGQGDAGDQGANGGQGENQNQDGGDNQQGEGGQGDSGQGAADGGQQDGEGQQQGENQQGQAGGGAGGGSEGEGQSQNGEGATGQGDGGSGQEGQQQDGAGGEGQNQPGAAGQQGEQTGPDGQAGDQNSGGGQPGGEQSQDGDQQGDNPAGGSPNGGQQQTGAGRQQGAPSENAGGGGQSERVSPDGVNDGEAFDRIREQMAEKDGTEELGEEQESQGADGQAGDQNAQQVGANQEQQARDGAAGQNNAAGQNANTGQRGGEPHGDQSEADQTGGEQTGGQQNGDPQAGDQTGDAGENSAANPGAQANPEEGGQTAGQRTGREGEQASGANTPRDETDPNRDATSEGDGETPAGADNAANANNGESPAGDQNAGQPGAPGATNKNPNDEGRGEENDQSGAPEEAPTGDARGRDESQARGESSGDRAGEGQRGGGQQADNAGEGEAGTHQAADTGQGQSADQGDGETGTEAGDQQTAEGQTGQSSGNQRGAGSETRDTGEQQGPGGENGDQQTQPGDAGSQDSQQGDNQQQGAGDQGAAGQQPQAGDQQNPAGGQQPGSEQQPGGQQPGGEQGGQDPAGGQQPGGQQAAGSNNAGAQQPGSQQPGGQQQPNNGEQQSSDQPPGDPSRDGSTGQGGSATNPTGGTSGGGVDGNDEITEPGGDQANLEYAKKQTDLVLERLSDQLAKQEVDQNLLKRLGWTEDELRQFVERWKKLKTEAAAEGPDGGDATERLNAAFKSIQVRPIGARRVEGTAASDDLQINDSFRGRAPQEWYERTRAYMKGVSSEGQ